MAGVGQHDTCQFCRSVSAVNGPFKTSFAQLGDEPGMVYMGMGKEHKIDFTRINAKILIISLPDLSVALKHAAIDPQGGAVCLDNKK